MAVSYSVWHHLMLELGARKLAKDAEAIVNGDKDDIVLRCKKRSIVLRQAT